MNVSSIQNEDLENLSQAYWRYYLPNDTQYRKYTLKNPLGKTLQEMLKTEIDNFLGYSKYECKNK